MNAYEGEGLVWLIGAVVCLLAAAMGLYVKIMLLCGRKKVNRTQNVCSFSGVMETVMRQRFWQKAKSIYYSLRSLLCFFVSVENDDVQPPDPPGSSGSEKAAPLWQVAVTSEKRVDGFPFQDLPEVCQLHVFSYLSVLERGSAATVCRRWNLLLQSAVLWTDVDLTVFPLCCRCGSRGTDDPCSSVSCYETYKDRVQSYMEHVERVRPSVRRLRFAFDIGDYADDWRDLLDRLIRSLRCSELASAQLNWKETPVKSAKIVEGTLLSWSATTFTDYTSYRRRRQRLFAGFFELFVSSAINVVDLSMPFDWSSRSLAALGRLRRLQVLKLDTYFVPQPVDQDAVDLLLRSVPQLRSLSLAVCVSSGAGLVPFRLHSRSLRHLDVAQCRGFYLGHVDLPRLTSLVAAVQPSHGPLGAVAAHRHHVDTIPCIYDILRHGAPALRDLNGYTLHLDWSDSYTDDLHAVLQDICACLAHAST